MTATLFDTGMERSAVISDCGKYRYLLTRRWGQGRPVNFIMLNPSTADANLDDPTIRRCIGFAKSWGHGSLVVTNLFAFRATDPKVLATLSHADALGPGNAVRVIDEAQQAALAVCAWGSNQTRGQGARMLSALREFGVNPHAIRLTKDGHPAHPLYLPSNLKPIPMENAL